MATQPTLSPGLGTIFEILSAILFGVGLLFVVVSDNPDLRVIWGLLFSGLLSHALGHLLP